MQYLGGKHRIAARIVEALPLHPHVDYVEPFCGALHVLSRVQGVASRCASDSNPALISMWRAVQQGWEPPDAITEADHRTAKRLPDSDPLKAFIGFGCSFAGKWFGGFCRNSRGDDYVGAARRSVLKLAPLIRDVEFRCVPYHEQVYPPFSIVYCDPPYYGTHGYANAGSFNTADFWRFFTALSETCFVFVSEYHAPPDWYSLLTIPTKTEVRTKLAGREDRTERLFCCREGLLGGFS